MSDVATLIEGIASSGYPLTWTAWTPTYGASESMTFTSVSTAEATYCQIGKLVAFRVSATGTVGGTASKYLTVTMPVTPSTEYSGLGGYIENNGVYTGVCLLNATSLRVYRYDRANWTLEAGSKLIISGLYSAA